MRQSLDLTQERLGELATLSYKFIGEVERAEVSATVDSLEKLAAGLSVEIVDLFTPINRTRFEITEKNYMVAREALDSLTQILPKPARGRTGRPPRRQRRR